MQLYFIVNSSAMCQEWQCNLCNARKHSTQFYFNLNIGKESFVSQNVLVDSVGAKFRVLRATNLEVNMVSFEFICIEILPSINSLNLQWCLKMLVLVEKLSSFSFIKFLLYEITIDNYHL